MIENLDEIKDLVSEYMHQERIAVFVGAGVSTLSQYPSWKKLVLSMADKIDYQITLKDINGNDSLSSDEYLKIPQFFYDTRGEKEYYSFVRKQLHTIKEPNEIHRMIMRLRPNHILTTNYDTLIEQAANRAGMSYSVINADDKVATAPTHNYILKVHGDFEANNFVLKESDYLNYNTNFTMIDNLMKSIISTHLVIFLGYSLGDYNIKLILNWVKQVQKDSFIEPIFIHTDLRELTMMELAYYKGENLKVIDANKLLDDPTTPSYLERYSSVLSTLIDSKRDEIWYRNETWIVDHFYKVFAPLKDVKYLRCADIASLFEGATIYLKNQLKYAEFDYLIKAYIKRDNLSKKRKQQLGEIINKLYNSGIDKIYGNTQNEELNSRIKRGSIIKNDTFDVSYQEVYDRIDNYGEDIESQYNKAYDLVWVGRLKEAMDTYYQLLADCYAHKRWILYFFTQINLFYLRQTIIILNNELSSYKGVIVLGKAIKFWDDDEIRDVRLSHILTDIPAEIKKYDFLEKLVAKNYYKDDFVDLCQDNYEIEKQIAKQSYTVAGRSKDDNLNIKIFDAINFIYGNKIIFYRFNEHKSFIKIALQQRFKGMMNQNDLAIRSYGENKNIKNHIGYQEVLLLIRNFSYDDLFVFFEKEKANELVLKKDSVKKFNNYILNLMEYFKNNFLKEIEEDKIIEYMMLKDEMKNALYLASYYVEKDDTVLECSKYIMKSLPDIELDINKRILLLERFKNKISDPTKILQLIEEDIVDRIQYCNLDKDCFIQSEMNYIKVEVDAIESWFEGFRSETILKSINASKDYVVNSISPILKNII